jgi:hypothetical protein
MLKLEANHLFFVECDRGTEPVAKGTARKTIREMFEQYQYIFDHDLHNQLFNLNAYPHLIHITTNATRMNTMLSMCDDRRFLHLTLTEFGKPFHVNRQPLKLLTTPFHRGHNPPYIIVR